MRAASIAALICAMAVPAVAGPTHMACRFEVRGADGGAVIGSGELVVDSADRLVEAWMRSDKAGIHLVEFRRDDAHRVIEKRRYIVTGKSEHLEHTLRMRYDGDRLSSSDMFDANGNVVYSGTYHYNDRGQLDRTRSTRPDGHFAVHLRYYDASGRVSAQRINDDASETMSVIKYSSKGARIQDAIYDVRNDQQVLLGVTNYDPACAPALLDDVEI
jgi:hypothetical protein